MSNNVLIYHADGSVFNATMLSDHRIGNWVRNVTWDSNWAQIVAFTDTADPYLLLYKPSGAMYTLPIVGSHEFGAISVPVIWDSKWSQVVPFVVHGQSFLLLYKRQTGEAFTMPIGPGPHFGGTTLLSAGWQHDWQHIVAFNSGNRSMLLFYSDTGAAYAFEVVLGGTAITPGHSSPKKISLGARFQLGPWETDWAHIVSFASAGAPYLLFCRSNGDAYTAPINNPQSFTDHFLLGSMTPVDFDVGGGLAPDVVHIVNFPLTDFTFGIDRITVDLQRSATDHADNDSISLVWTVTSALSKQMRTGSKTVKVSSGDGAYAALISGESIDGPFATDPIRVTPTDVVTVTAQINNLGSSSQRDQEAQAYQLTQTLVADIAPIIGAIIGSAIGVGPIAGFEKGKEIGEVAGWAFKAVGDLAGLIGINVGPAHCNGEVMNNTWVYDKGDFAAAGATLAGSSQAFDGPGSDGCGLAPRTTLTWSVRPGV